MRQGQDGIGNRAHRSPQPRAVAALSFWTTHFPERKPDHCVLDRFALSVDIVAPLEAQERQAIVERRVVFDRNPATFAKEWSAEQQELREKIGKGRDRVRSIHCSSEILGEIGAPSVRLAYARFGRTLP